MPGVTAVHVIAEAGKEMQWAGAEIVAVAAERAKKSPATPLRKIKVQYEVLPHLVHEADLAKAGKRAKAAGEQVTGDPDKAFQEAAVVVRRALRHSRDHALLPGIRTAIWCNSVGRQT